MGPAEVVLAGGVATRRATAPERAADRLAVLAGLLRATLPEQIMGSPAGWPAWWIVPGNSASRQTVWRAAHAEERVAVSAKGSFVPPA